MSHPTMGAWIEICSTLKSTLQNMSHPTMGAWIEIFNMMKASWKDFVAPHDGCVD